MLDSLKKTGENIGREIGRAWNTLSDGWRELLSRGSDSLTRFTQREESGQEESALATFPRWSLLAGELEETTRDVVVRVEVPGMDKDDCQITIEGNLLRISGEKRLERDTHDSTYHVMERAYGAFERTIALPRNVDVERAEAGVKNGVLTVRLPKTGIDRSRSLKVS